MSELVVFGEALIDLQGGADLDFRGHVGGSPLNVALAATRLGVRAALATRVSTDLFGEAIVAHLSANEVDTALLERGPEPTTLAFVTVEDGSARYSFRNHGAADTRYAADPPPDLRAARAVHFGSVSLLFPPASPRILELVRRARSSALVLLDPNVRPSLIGDPAAYRRAFAAWLGLSHWLKLSREDLDFLAPGETEEAVTARWLDLGPRAVVVTDGSDGARLYRPGRPILETAAPRVTVVDTIGAGDTFSGATAAALLERGLDRPGRLEAASDHELEAVLAFAARAAAINCTRPGCDPPSRAELDAAP